MGTLEDTAPPGWSGRKNIVIPEIEEGACFLEASGLPVVERKRDQVLLFRYPAINAGRYSTILPADVVDEKAQLPITESSAVDKEAQLAVTEGSDQRSSYEYDTDDNDGGSYYWQPNAAVYPVEEAMKINLPPVSEHGLRVVDFEGCNEGKAKAFIAALVGTAQSGYQSKIADGIFSEKLSKKDGFITGVSLRASTRNHEKLLTLFASIPYLGLRRKQEDNSSRTSAGSLGRSRTLHGYRFIDSDNLDSNLEPEAEKSILVHQTWFILFNNKTIGIFRSEEDELVERAPLFPYQARRGAIQALVHMISNTITASERAALKAFRKLVSELEHQIRVDFAATNEADMDKKADNKNSTTKAQNTPEPDNDGNPTIDFATAPAEEETPRETRDRLIRKFEDRTIDVSTMLRLVRSQIEYLQDLLHIFQNTINLKWNSNRRRHWNHFEIPYINEKEELMDVLPTLEGIIKERARALDEITALLEDMEMARSVFTQDIVKNQEKTQRQMMSAVEQQEKTQRQMATALEQQGQTISVFTFITTIFLPLGFLCTYFSMSLQTTVTSQTEFWSISGPITVGITLLLSPFLFGKDDEIKIWLLKILAPWTGVFSTKDNSEKQLQSLPIVQQTAPPSASRSGFWQKLMGRGKQKEGDVENNRPPVIDDKHMSTGSEPFSVNS